MTEVIDIRTEYDINPLGIDEPIPRFSWSIASSHAKYMQKAYQIQVSISQDFTTLVWDTGWVESSCNVFINYKGECLAPRTRYFIRVRISDTNGIFTPWPKGYWFETAFLGDPWKAPFITSPAEVNKKTGSIFLRREFFLSKDMIQGRLYATALGVYEIWLNGKRVSHAVLTPGWSSYHSRLAYQVYDVTNQLRQGQNVITAMIADGWYAGELTWELVENIYGKVKALSLEMRGMHTDLSEIVIDSDETQWYCFDGPIRYSQLYHGEIYDARYLNPKWFEPGYSDQHQIQSIAISRPQAHLSAQEAPFVKPMELVSPVSSFITPAGEHVLDFGQNLTGRIRFSVDGRRGDQVVLRHAEVLNKEGNVHLGNLRKADCKITYVLNGNGVEQYEPHFTFQGFRYVRIDKYPGEVNPNNFQAVVLHSDLELTSEFSCSNPYVNRLYQNIIWSWKGNTVDVPTDCPQRDERLGWTGDAQVFISTATCFTQAGSFFSKWLKDLSADQLSDGGVPFVIPDVLTGVVGRDGNLPATHSSAGWGDAATVCPWTLYQRYGDIRVLERQYTSMKAWVSYIKNQADKDGIWRNGFHFGDWLALDAKEGSCFGATPNDLCSTAYYAHSAFLTSKAAEVLGYTEDAWTYSQLAKKVRAAFQGEFLDHTGRLKAKTQTSHVLALAFDLVDTNMKDQITNDLVTLITQRNGALSTGFLGTPMLCKVLSDHGRSDIAYQLLLRRDYPSWMYQIDRGASTVWEHWDSIKTDDTMWSDDMNSFNHYAYGAVGSWMYEAIGGINLGASRPASGEFVFQPKISEHFTWCRCSYRSFQGKLSVSWRRWDKHLNFSCDIPPNTTLTVCIDKHIPEELLLPGRHKKLYVLA